MPTPVLFLDIETIPDQRPGAKERVTAALKAPGQYKKPESIAEWIKENADAAWRKTALDPLDGGEIVCIGWAISYARSMDNSEWWDGEVSACVRGKGDDEAVFIDKAMDMIRESFPTGRFHPGTIIGAIAHQSGWQGRDAVLVGSNIREFDLPYLVTRCRICGVEIPTWLMDAYHGMKPGGGKVVDTCTDGPHVGKKTKMVSLAKYARGMNLGEKLGDGSQVYDLWLQDPQKVADYCRQDVALTRAVYRKLEGLWR